MLRVADWLIAENTPFRSALLLYGDLTHKAWSDELKLLKGTHVCRSNTHPDMKTHVIERLATDH